MSFAGSIGDDDATATRWGEIDPGRANDLQCFGVDEVPNDRGRGSDDGRCGPALLQYRRRLSTCTVLGVVQGSRDAGTVAGERGDDN
jgi:hypothetical protein